MQRTLQTPSRSLLLLLLLPLLLLLVYELSARAMATRFPAQVGRTSSRHPRQRTVRHGHVERRQQHASI
jgi:hypothetical protein